MSVPAQSQPEFDEYSRRVESGTTYTQTFDVDNRLTQTVSGTLTTQFGYDADADCRSVLRVARWLRASGM